MERYSEDQPQDTPEPSSFSPKQSVGHKLLLDTAKAGGIVRGKVRELLWLLNAPPDIENIAPVLENLAATLKGAEEQWPGIFDLQNLDWVQKLIEDLQEVVRSLPLLDTSAQHGRRDWLERNALYCAIRMNPSLPADYLGRYRLLQAHYFFAHTAWLVRNAQSPSAPTDLMAFESYGGAKVWPALRIDPYHAGLCIRDLAEPEYRSWAQELLEKLPVAETPREFPAHASVHMETDLQKDKDGRVKFSVQKKVNYVSDYLREIYGIKDRVEGHGGTRGLRRFDSEIGDPEDPTLNFGILTDWDNGQDSIPKVAPLVLSPPEAITPVPPATEQATREAFQEADEDTNEDEEVPDDEYEGEEETESFAGSLDCEDTEYEKSPGSFSGRAFGAVHQIIRQQKMFPFAIERLSGWELFPLGTHGAFIIDELWDLAKRRIPLQQHRLRRWENSGLGPRAEIQALVFLMVMLWNGSDAKRATSLIVAKSEGLLGDEPFAIVTGHSPWPFVRIHVPFPKYKTEQAPALDYDCKRREYIALPDYANLWLAVKTYATMQQIGGDRFQPFPGAPEAYAENVRLLLKAWDPSGRLTLNKIASTLFARVMTVTGNDSVAATIITGNSHRLSKVAMHYACREVSVIQEIYRSVVSDLQNDIDKGRTISWQNRSASDSIPTDLQPRAKYERRSQEACFIGRRLCPQDVKFRQAFHNLIEDLNDKPYTSSSNDALIKFHNVYTFYTMWAFAMTTGVRKMRTPYVDVSEISPINGVAKLRDKDGDSGIKAKLVWIPDLVVEQMRYYTDHLKYIRERFDLGL